MEVKVDSSTVVNNLDKFIISQLPQAIEQGLDKACFVIEADAKRRCPVDDGQLRGSISHQVEGTHGEVGTNVEYAPYVEVGTGIYSTKGGGRQTPWTYKDAKGEWHTTKGMKSQPYLQPAVESNLSKVLQCFEGLI